MICIVSGEQIEWQINELSSHLAHLSMIAMMMTMQIDNDTAEKLNATGNETHTDSRHQMLSIIKCNVLNGRIACASKNRMPIK